MYFKAPVRTGAIAMLSLLTIVSVSWAQPQDAPPAPSPAQPKAQPNEPKTAEPLAQPKAQPNEPKTARGFLGVYVTPGEPEGKGIVVRDVTPGTPAAKAGLQPGDRIVKMDDANVMDPQKFLQTIATKQPGDKVNLGVLRGGKEQMMAVTIGERAFRKGPQVPQDFPGPGFGKTAFLGVQMEPLNPQLKKQLNLDVDSGVVVMNVVPNSPAAKAGLKRDDVITSINNHPIKGPQDLREAVQQSGSGKELTVEIIRGKEKKTVKATPQSGPFSMRLLDEDPFPTWNVNTFFDRDNMIRDMERRIEGLEKHIRELENK